MFGKRFDLGPFAYLVALALGIAGILFALRFFSTDNVVVAVFFALLPLTNAVFDWLSYGTTIWLLNLGWKKKSHGRFWPFLTGIADLLAAFLFFLALSLTLLAVLHAANTFSGQPFFDIAKLLNQIEQDHWQVLWVIAMIASTFLPTFVHLSIAAFSLLTALPVKRWQSLIAKSDEGTHGSSAIVMRLWFPFEAMALTSLPLLVIALIGWGLWVHGGGLVDFYAQILRSFADALGLLAPLPVVVDT